MKEWFEDIKEKCNTDETVIVLVGNKCDNDADNQVPIQQGKAVSKEIGAHIFEEISAKEDIRD